MVTYKNTQALNDFVHFHGLRNKDSVIEFMARVTIKTAKSNVENLEAKVMVTTNGYDNPGAISFVEAIIDPYIYPTDFNSKWQTFEHVDKVYLKINGDHTKNPDIGTYEVKIVPIRRTRD